MGERLYSTAQAGQLLGGISADAVQTLIKDGKLRGKYQPIRGHAPGTKRAKPRLYITGSELDRYIESLPEVGDPPPPVPERPRRGRLPSSLAKEFEAAAKYMNKSYGPRPRPEKPA